MSNEKDTIIFEIKEHLGVIAEYSTGWKKELNLISWNGGPLKFDIRDWDPEHMRMSRGITLMPEEMQKLVELARKREERVQAAKGTQRRDNRDFER